MHDGKKIDPETLKSKVSVEVLQTRFRPIYDEVFADLIAKLNK